MVIEGKRILTNAHVVAYASQIQIQANQAGDKVNATVVAIAPGIDLAVLKLDDETFFETHDPLARANTLPEIKDAVLAYGYPTGGTSLSITKGIVSRIEFTPYNPPVAGLRIQIDAAINPGNSGGPLLDSAGRLVGVNTAIQSPSGASAGIGFAVPADTVNRVVPQLIARGKLERPDLGFDPVAARWLERFGVKEGVMVADVRRGGPAERAGLQGVTQDRRGRFVAGDLIVAADGKAVKGWDDLLDLAESLAPGASLSLDVRREDRRFTVSLRPGKERSL